MTLRISSSHGKWEIRFWFLQRKATQRMMSTSKHQNDFSSMDSPSFLEVKEQNLETRSHPAIPNPDLAGKCLFVDKRALSARTALKPQRRNNKMHSENVTRWYHLKQETGPSQLFPYIATCRAPGHELLLRHFASGALWITDAYDAMYGWGGWSWIYVLNS